MILDRFDRADKYSSCHRRLAAGFDFLKNQSLDKLPDGKLEIDGEWLFAICAHDQGRGQEASPLEFHRKYIDIQYVVSGEELIGWQMLDACKHIQQPYDAQRDIGFYADRPHNWFKVPPDAFAIFFPEDAHAPLAAQGPVHKIVVKVRVE
jgi:biofilm protein TabA